MWEEDKFLILQKHFEVINTNTIALFAIMKEHMDEIHPILPIVEFILERIHTVTELIAAKKVWDAEIVLRPVVETFVKLMFITSSEGEEKERRLDEYWNSLSEIDSLRMSEQAKINLRYFGDSELHRVAYLPLILPEEEEKILREKWPRKKRVELEQKWSFTRMIKYISDQNKGTPLEMFLTLTFSYRISNHIMHGDQNGISIIKERQTRSPEEYNEAVRGHFVRLISDCNVYCAYVAVETMEFLNLQDEKKFFIDNVMKIKDIDEITNVYLGKVFEDPMYNKYRESRNT